MKLQERLALFVGLVRYDEVAVGAINHAVRYTLPLRKRLSRRRRRIGRPA